MENVSLKNLPYGKLFKFDANCYVIKVKRYATVEGNYVKDVKRDFLDIFALNSKDDFNFLNSGSLSGNGVDAQGCFKLFDPDYDESFRFRQTIDLELVNDKYQEKIQIIEKQFSKKDEQNFNQNSREM